MHVDSVESLRKSRIVTPDESFNFTEIFSKEGKKKRV